MTLGQKLIARWQEIRRKEGEQCLGMLPSVCIMGYVEWHEMAQAVRLTLPEAIRGDFDFRKVFEFQGCTIYVSLTVERGIFFGNNFIP